MNNRKKCQLCKEPMARWLYGEPNYEALREQILNNEIVIGGCSLSNHSPKWACLTCCISYRSDGIGYLDHNLVENYENNQDKWFFLQDSALDYKQKEIVPYQFPAKIQAIRLEDFLEKNGTKRSIGFYFHKGGYGGEHTDIKYLDGIMVWDSYDSLSDAIFLRLNQIPKRVYILPLKVKKVINDFIINSKWKKSYFQPILDGTQWEFNRLFDQKIKKSYGSNDFPPVYEEFEKILNKISLGWNGSIDSDF